jgi:UDP-N-acetylglucosamine acyltransferase
VGINVSIHQRLSIGEGAMVGMGAIVTRDIPAWQTWYGNPATFRGPNTEGMRRHGLTE